MRRSIPTLLVGLAVLALSAACGDDDTSAEGGAVTGRVAVVATTTHLTDFVRIVGGNHVDVHGILPANVDPHDYEPSPADVARLAAAKVIVKNGVGLEEWFDATIRNAEPQATIVDASTGVDLHRGDDPHIWLDPRNAKVMVRNITAALVAADPERRGDYEANEAAYVCLLYTSPSPRDKRQSRMPSSA